MKLFLFLLVVLSVVVLAHQGHSHNTSRQHTPATTSSNFINAIAASFVLSLLSFVGILVIDENNLALLSFMTSMAIGSMLGDVFFHIFPHVFEHYHKTDSFVILSAILFCFLIDSYFHMEKKSRKNSVRAAAYINLSNDAIHNFFDGIGLVGAFSISNTVGFTTFLAMVFHEIPQELSDYAILIHSGLSKKMAMLANFVCGLFSVLGCAFAYFLSLRLAQHQNLFMCWTAGSFLYISCVEMFPHVLKRKSTLYSFLGIVFGISLTFAIEFAGHAH